MPAKGKHHHLSHHHHHHQSQQQQQQHQHQQHQQQQQQQHQAQQHLVNVHQTGGTGTPQPYNTVVSAARGYVSHAGSDFHVPGQSYGAQAGGQVGGGGGSIGVPGARGPPSLGTIQSIGQTPPGIQSGTGTSGGQQQQTQTSTPGIQSQQPPGPVPTTTPPTHTPSPQEMGKPVHHQTQQPSLQYPLPNQPRPVAQGFYSMGPRPVQPRNSSYRNNQGGGAAQVVGMSNVGGSIGQPSAVYSQHTMNGPGTQLYLQNQVTGMHTNPHQPQLFHVNTQIPPQLAFQQQHRHQHQTPNYYGAYAAPSLMSPSLFQFASSHPAQLAYCFPQHAPSTNMNLARAPANAVSGGAAHVSGPLTGAQTNTGITQGGLQQSHAMQQIVYAGYNGDVTNSSNTTSQKVIMRPNALRNIKDPKTGENIADVIYQSAGSDNKSQSQGSTIAADFKSNVALAAKSVSEKPSTDSKSVAITIKENHQQPADTQSSSSNSIVQNSQKSQSSSRDNAPIEIQCNLNSPITAGIAINPAQSSSETTHSMAPVADVPCSLVVSETTSSSVHIKDEKPECEITHGDNTKKMPIKSKDENLTVDQSNTDNVSKLETQSKKNSLSIDSQSNTVDEKSVPVVASVEFHSSKESHDDNQSEQQQSQISSSSVALSINPCTDETLPIEAETEEKEINGDKTHTSSTTLTYNDNIHQKANGEPSGDKSEFEAAAQIDCLQKSTDGKAMQKQKSKNRLKGRDLNRKGAEKEGTDMDAFVNAPLQSAKVEKKVQEQDKEETHSQITATSNNTDQQQQIEQEKLNISGQAAESKELDDTKNEINKAKSDAESKQQVVNRMPLNQQTEKVLPKECVINEMIKSDKDLIIDKNTVSIENHKDSNREMVLEVKDSNKYIEESEKKTNDVVDHVKMNDVIDVDAVVAQKNEENVKASSAQSETTSNTDDSTIDGQTITIDNRNVNAPLNQNDSETKTSTVPTLKYQYNDYQWSPNNTSGKREYDREFLMKLQNDPRCHVKPSNLPDLDVVLRDGLPQNNRTGGGDMRVLKESRAHEQLFPTFAKFSFNAKLPPLTKKSYQGRSKPSKPNQIHLSLSLREDVKLRESENAWKPTRLKEEVVSEDDLKTQVLYKKVRSVLNKLTPQKFSTLVNQVRSLEIDTQGRLQGVIDLVFEKAIDEPNFSVAYALMCKELGCMKVTSTEKSPQDSDSFKKLLVTRCQMEFEKNAVDELARLTKVQEIEQCTDPEKKKELQLSLEEADRQLRRRSVGNIRFIGELYKQDTLTTGIMHKCITHLLLKDIDEENLECLCKLLTTIGKIIENKMDLSPFFSILSDLTNRKSNKKISSRVRFMIQDVIDLRKNRWIPRRDESNPKTMDQIQKEAESERFEFHLNNTPMNTPRRDDRNNDRRRNRTAGPNMNDGWSAPVGKSRTPYSVEMSKLNTKASPIDDITLGNRDAYVWGTTAAKSNTVTQNKYAALGSTALDQDKPQPLSLSGSRSTGSREYKSDYKSSWDGRNSRNSSHQMGSGNSSNSNTTSTTTTSSSSSSSSKRDGSQMENTRSQSTSMPPPSAKYKSSSISEPMGTTTSNIETAKLSEAEEQLLSIFKNIIDKSNLLPSTEAFLDAALQTIDDNFDDSSYPRFVQHTMNTVLERSAQVRQRISILLSHLINKNIITLQLVQDECEKVMKYAEELVIDIPKFWVYFAEIFSEMVVLGAHPLAELKKTLAVPRSKGFSGVLLGELLSKLAKDRSPNWVANEWNQSGLEWNDVIDTERTNIDSIIQKYNLQFLTNGGCSSSEKSLFYGNLSLEDIYNHLLKLIRESNFDNITSWIEASVGNGVKEPQFIRVLTTAILNVSIDALNESSWRLNSETFKSLLPLIARYVDTVPQLELQCLYAIHGHIYRLMHPQGVLCNIIEALYDGNVISDEAFLAWEKSTDQKEMQGHAIAVKTLTSFFVNLREPRDESSEEA